MLTLINLDSARERREQMTEQLDVLGVNHERVGIDLRRTADAAIDAWLAGHLPGIGFDRSELSGAEVGCWASHLIAWTRLAAAGRHAATVLEDDLLLSADFRAVITTIETQSPFDIVFLGTSSRNISTRRCTMIGNLRVHAPVGAITRCASTAGRSWKAPGARCWRAGSAISIIRSIGSCSWGFTRG